MRLIKVIIGFGVLIFSAGLLFSQSLPASPPGSFNKYTTVQLIHPILVDKFYSINQQELFWFSTGEQSSLLRLALKNGIDSSASIGLDKTKYHYADLAENMAVSFSSTDSFEAMAKDRIFTDIAIAYCKDIYQGINISSWINADEISSKYAEADNNYILDKLVTITSDLSLRQFLNSLEPKEKEYQLLKAELQQRFSTGITDSAKPLTTSLHLFRWIQHFHIGKYIVVNIPSATLKYYENDTLKLKMKVVLGKPSTRTPRFAAYCNQIILYPYWNVPRKIMLNEFFPLFKKSPDLIAKMNMQVVDEQGKIINPDTLNWPLYDKTNFPYRIRQSGGCDNALGVIKFNLTSPYDIYMHDTNLKSAFQSAYRYYSHGCIRLEKPVELGNYLLNGQLDSAYLQSCLKDQKPITLELKKPVPVFVVYRSVEINEADKVEYYKDLYGLLK